MSDVVAERTFQVRARKWTHEILNIGQRVVLSKIGSLCLSGQDRIPATGVVVAFDSAYPDSVMVSADGFRKVLSYHRSYWSPA